MLELLFVQLFHSNLLEALGSMQYQMEVHPFMQHAFSYTMWHMLVYTYSTLVNREYCILSLMQKVLDFHQEQQIWVNNHPIDRCTRLWHMNINFHRRWLHDFLHILHKQIYQATEGNEWIKPSCSQHNIYCMDSIAFQKDMFLIQVVEQFRLFWNSLPLVLLLEPIDRAF